MDFAEITAVLPSAPFSAIPGLLLAGVRIYLYRDSAPRPQERFWPVNVDDVYDSPFKPLQTSRADFEVFCDLASLARPHPFRFYTFTFGLQTDQGVVRGLLFEASCVADAGPSGDLAALRSLLGLLRSFPAGWTQTAAAEWR